MPFTQAGAAPPHPERARRGILLLPRPLLLVGREGDSFLCWVGCVDLGFGGCLSKFGELIYL